MHDTDVGRRDALLAGLATTAGFLAPREAQAQQPNRHG